MASTPTESAGPSSPPSEPGLAWSRLVARVRQAKPAIASVLEHAHVLRFGPDGVALGFAANTFYWDSARDPDVRAVLTRVLAEQFGQTVALELSPLDGAPSQAPASLAAQHDAGRKQRERDIEQTALTHPAVRDAISVLGGEVTAVVPLADLDDAGGEGR